ncbi:SOSS complex subunit B family protein [Nanoarchaeota archaeon]
MAIKDLEARQGDIDIIADVVDKEEVREFEKFGKTGRVCNAKIKDETGEVKLTLWNDDIDKINVGDRVHIEKGYVGEWQGELQLSTGKFGTLTVVSKEQSSTATETTDEGEHILTEDEKTEEEVLEEKPKEPSVEESATEDEVQINEEKIE